MTRNRVLLSANLLGLFLTSVATAQLPEGYFTDARRVPGVNSSSAEWGNVEVSPDNLTLYFASERSGGYGGQDLYQATRTSVNDDWGNVMNLGAGVNTSSFEANPGVTADGTTMYFTSNRSGGEGGYDIYVATRTSPTEEFGDVQNLGPGVNSHLDEGSTSRPSDELSIFYCVYNRAGGFGRFDIYTATRSSEAGPFGASTNVGGGVNTVVDEFAPFVTPDESFLLFSDRVAPYRPGGEGSADIWVATQSSDGTFGSVANLGDVVNTSYNDAFPVLSPDWPEAGSTLYFLSDQPGTSGAFDFWQATWVPQTSGIEDTDVAHPGLLSLRSSPNPFSLTTTARFDLPSAGPVELGVYGASGQLVRSLHHGHMSAGFHQITWDGRDASGTALPSGVYFVKLQGARSGGTERVMIVR